MKRLLASMLWLGLTVAVAEEDQTAAYQRIDAERAKATAGFDAEDAECAQRFAVSGCLKNVQSRRRAAMADFRRQESVLRERDLALQAQEQRQSAEQKASERRQQESEWEASNGAARAAENLRSQKEKRAAHAAQAGSPDTKAAAQSDARKPRSGPTPAEQAANRASYAHKQQEAEKKRQEVARRVAEKASNPAAPLPVPPVLPLPLPK